MEENRYTLRDVLSSTPARVILAVVMIALVIQGIRVYRTVARTPEERAEEERRAHAWTQIRAMAAAQRDRDQQAWAERARLGREAQQRAQERESFGSWVIVARDDSGAPERCWFALTTTITQRPGHVRWTRADGTPVVVEGNVSVGAYTRFDGDQMVSRDIDAVFRDLGMPPDQWFARCEDTPMDNWRRIERD